MKFFLFICLLTLSFPAFAQNKDERLALAKQFHEIKPIKGQIDRAIETVAKRIPEQQQKSFESTIKRSLSYNAIENFSINAMAELFTKAELDAMIEYYSKPEAKSASEKLSAYQDKIRPEIIKMLDRAMMEMRTGASGG